MQILVYGYGNPGRQDDAIGNAFVELVEKWCHSNNILNVKTDSNYQLNVEDADTIAKYDKVFFVDASYEDIENFVVSKLKPDKKASFSTHAAHPAYILSLCNEFYGMMPETYLFHIRGYGWDFLGNMTTKAKKNLMDAFKFFVKSYENKFNDLRENG